MPAALIVHAHPEPRSFVSGMKDVACDVLGGAGYDVTVSDLYAQPFDPVAKPSDFTDRQNPSYLRYAREQRHAFKAGALAPDVQREFDRLMAADLLVLTFPLFWFSTPAILKGWFDRVLLPGPVYSGRRIYDRGGLAGKRAIVGCALGGRRHMFGENAVHGHLEALLSHLLRGTLGYTGLSVLPPFCAHHVPYLEKSDRNALMKGWSRHLGQIDSLDPIPMPNLDDFDDLLRPLVELDGSASQDA